jgi:hypothetical protein
VDDEIDSSKGKGLWRAAGEAQKARHRKGEKRFRAARKGLDTTVELSYLPVSGDLPWDPVQLPKRIRQRSVERGHYFVNEHYLPIKGPKTFEEVEEEAKMDRQMVDYMQRYSPARIRQEAMK